LALTIALWGIDVGKPRIVSAERPASGLRNDSHPKPVPRAGHRHVELTPLHLDPLHRWGAGGLGDYETDDAIAYDATLDRFLAATRHDLGMNANLLTEDDIIR
jgi:hypothetical protein